MHGEGTLYSFTAVLTLRPGAYGRPLGLQVFLISLQCVSMIVTAFQAETVFAFCGSLPLLFAVE
jgi:hypothetical protein